MSILKPPFFTIITTVKNGFSDIEITINSVLSQTFTDYEYIIIDGGSSDGTDEIIFKIIKGNNNVKFYKQFDEGLYFALNKAIDYSSGEIISILHAGDYFFNDHVLLDLNNFIINNSKTDIFAAQAGARFLFANNSFADSFKDKSSFYKRFLFMPLNHPSLFISRSYYKKYGSFDTRFPIAADYELVLKLFKNNIPIFYIDKIFVSIAPLGISGKKINLTSIKELYDIKSIYFPKYISFLTCVLLFFYLKYKNNFV